jgi:hypothetical protein
MIPPFSITLVNNAREIAHYGVELIIFGCVDRGNAFAQKRGFIFWWNNAAHDERDMRQAFILHALGYITHKLNMRAGQNGEADTMNIVLARGFDNLGRG